MGWARRLTEAQAWTYLAARWDRAQTWPDGFGVHMKGETREGICPCLVVMGERGKTTWEVVDQMSHRMRYRRRREDGFVWPLTPAGARARAAFCRRMAKLAARENGRHTEEGGETR